MSEISESTELLADEKSDILSKNVLGKSKKWDNGISLIFVLFLFDMSAEIEFVFAGVDRFRNENIVPKIRQIDNILCFFAVYNLFLCLAIFVITSRITQRFLRLWAILAIFNIFIGFAYLLYFYNHFTTDPNAKEHFNVFKYTLLSMPIWWFIYIFANGFGALVLWRISNMKRDYYGDEMYLVIYGGEESSTKKMEFN